jgi:TolA-binding protein
MRKAIAVAAAIAALALATGCASMWKALGVETVKSQEERASAQRQASDETAAGLRQENEELKAQVAELKETVDRLSLQMDGVEKAQADIERVQALVDALERRVDLIPQETLRKLADIFARAAREAEAPAPAAEPDGATGN